MNIIKNAEQFFDILNSGKGTQYSFYSEVKEVIRKLEEKNKPYTVFTIRDDNDEAPWYITSSIGIVNSIGYYILTGNYQLENEYLEL